jgi:hypothetical protein
MALCSLASLPFSNFSTPPHFLRRHARITAVTIKPDVRQAEDTPSDVAPGAEMVLHVVQKRAYQIEFLGSPVLIGLLLFDNGPALTP